MAKVAREVSIEFDGQRYTFAPSNRLMRRIEADMYPMTLSGLVNCMQMDQVPLPSLAFVLTEFIKAGGGDADEDDIYDELVSDLADNKGEGLKSLLMCIDAVMTPPDFAAKNSPAPSPGGRKPAGKRKKA